MNPFLAIGQILVSIALIAAILLQARGSGLSGTFGGDSAVYRSRRGVERRLWQFTIVLLVLFVLFSLASFIFAADHRLSQRSRRPSRVGITSPSSMTRIDHARRRRPSSCCSRHRRPRRRPGARCRPRAHRRRPTPTPADGRARTARASSATRSSVSPLTPGRRPTATSSRSSSRASSATAPTARSCPDLADRWTVDPTGTTWTFQLRDDARWHDGEPVTADDVVYTIQTPPGPGLHGPGRRLLERGHRRGRRRADGPVHARRRRSAASSRPRPSRSPRPISSPTSRSTSWPTTRSAAQPVGSGPFALDRARRRPTPSCEPAASVQLGSPEGGDATRRRSPRTRSRRTAPTHRPSRPGAVSGRMEFRFFDDPAELAAAYRDGPARRGVGSRARRRRRPRPVDARRAALRYPGATLTAVSCSTCARTHPEFARSRGPDRRCSRRSTGPRSSATRSRSRATVADGADPADVAGLFDATASPPVPYDAKAAARRP